MAPNPNGLSIDDYNELMARILNKQFDSDCVIQELKKINYPVDGTKEEQKQVLINSGKKVYDRYQNILLHENEQLITFNSDRHTQFPNEYKDKLDLYKQIENEIVKNENNNLEKHGIFGKEYFFKLSKSDADKLKIIANDDDNKFDNYLKNLVRYCISQNYEIDEDVFDYDEIPVAESKFDKNEKIFDFEYDELDKRKKTAFAEIRSDILYEYVNKFQHPNSVKILNKGDWVKVNQS